MTCGKSTVSRLGVLAACSILLLPGALKPADAVAATGTSQAAGDDAAAKRAEKLDVLFAKLQKATSRLEARLVEHDIWRVWLQSGDPELDKRMQASREAMARGHFGQALTTLNALIKDAPHYMEAWNKRATVLYLVNRLDDSLADIDKVLELEPRHFGAISGISLIMIAKGRNKQAIKAVERALAIHPYLPGAKQIIKRAGGKDGEPI